MSRIMTNLTTKQEYNARFHAETKKDKLLASFAKFLLPVHEKFEIEDVKDRWVIVDRVQFKEVYAMGVEYYMGMKISWL